MPFNFTTTEPVPEARDILAAIQFPLEAADRPTQALAYWQRLDQADVWMRLGFHEEEALRIYGILSGYNAEVRALLGKENNIGSFSFKTRHENNEALDELQKRTQQILFESVGYKIGKQKFGQLTFPDEEKYDSLAQLGVGHINRLRSKGLVPSLDVLIGQYETERAGRA